MKYGFESAPPFVFILGDGHVVQGSKGQMSFHLVHFWVNPNVSPKTLLFSDGLATVIFHQSSFSVPDSEYQC